MYRTKYCVKFALTCVGVFTLFRAWLFFLRFDDLSALDYPDLFSIFRIGFRLDGVIVGASSALFILGLLLIPSTRPRGGRLFAKIFCGFSIFIFVAAEISSTYFFKYYDFRPNYLVIEHGADTEVWGTVLSAYPVFAIFGISILLTWILLKWILSATNSSSESGNQHGPPTKIGDKGILLALFFLAVMAARGTLDHRPLNPSYASFSSNRVANELAGSNLLNVFYELNQYYKNNYVPVESVIDVLDKKEAVHLLQEYYQVNRKFSGNSPNPLAREINNPAAANKLNVVVVVMESFMARLIGSLGGELDLSPNFNKLAEQGVLLENCYATGERTVQGLEAVISSFPPLPGVSVIRRPQAQTGFSTLASVLKQRQYKNIFFYGGQGIFDHMKGFFLGNGFERFLEEEDFDNVTFASSWGVCDEDVFHRANSEFQALANQGQPFFGSILTVSLHSPWTYPDGKIEKLPKSTKIPAGFDYEELNNFLYADYSLGKFMEEAKSLPYFEDTVFVFVGDHGVHLRGRELIPIDEYRVGALFYCPKHLSPKRISKTTSQLDIAPTLMGILGGTYRSTFFGKDVFNSTDEDGHALVVYQKKIYGALQGNKLTTFDKSPQVYMTKDAETAMWEESSIATTRHNELGKWGTSILQIGEDLLMSKNYSTTGKISKR